MSEASSSSSNDDSSAGHHSNDPLSILQPLSYQATLCGYCSSKKGSAPQPKTGRSYGCWAHSLSCKTYKDLIDQGWRRSGKYLYKPDMRACCCPQYTISLDAAAFTPTKSQRQLLHRFSTFLIEGGREGTSGWGPASQASNAADKAAPRMASTSKLRSDSLLSSAMSVTFNPAAQPSIDDDDDSLLRSPKKTNGTLPPHHESHPAEKAAQATAQSQKGNKGKGKAASKAQDFFEMVHEGDWVNSPIKEPFKHRFEYVLEEASFTEEKYELFRQYQLNIHGEPEEKVTPKGFRRFLVDSPLEIEPTGHHQHNYGSHHAKYILDGKLIALAVLDILPTCVSSVYFAWDPAYAAMSLGKVSALREAAMVREMHNDGLEDMERYMMGFYIQSCPKMRYKGEYQPSSLLDPETNVFYPWEHCKPLLDRNSHASFSNPTQPLRPNPPPPTPSSHNDPGSPMSVVSNGNGSDDDGESVPEDEDVEWPSRPPPGFLDVKALPKSLLIDTVVIENRTLVPLLFSSAWHDQETALEIKRCLAATGERVAGRIAMWMP